MVNTFELLHPVHLSENRAA